MDTTNSVSSRRQLGTGRAPLGEECEEYDLEILDGIAVARSVSGLPSPTFTYTITMMTADFGGSLGRGAPAEA